MVQQWFEVLIEQGPEEAGELALDTQDDVLAAIPDCLWFVQSALSSTSHCRSRGSCEKDLGLESDYASTVRRLSRGRVKRKP